MSCVLLASGGHVLQVCPYLPMSDVSRATASVAEDVRSRTRRVRSVNSAWGYGIYQIKISRWVFSVCTAWA